MLGGTPAAVKQTGDVELGALLKVVDTLMLHLEVILVGVELCNNFTDAALWNGSLRSSSST